MRVEAMIGARRCPGGCVQEPRGLPWRKRATCPGRAARRTLRLARRCLAAAIHLLLALLLMGPALAAGEAAASGEPRAVDPRLRLSPDERSWLAPGRRVRVATKLEWSPIDLYGYEGRFRGLSGDFLHRIGQLTGIEFEFVPMPTLADGLRALREGRADLVPSVSRTPVRERYMRFTRAYLDVPNIYVARRGVGPVGEDSDMAGLRVAVERGYAVIETIRERHPKAAVVEFDDSAAALRGVSEGQADAYMGALSTTTLLVERLLLNNLEIRGTWRTELSALHLGVAAGNAILQSILDKALAEITLAERQEIHRRWVPLRNLLAGPAPPLQMSAGERRLVEQMPALRVGFDEAHIPYTFRSDDGEFVGMARDYLELVLRRTGLALGEPSAGTWPQVYEAARLGEVDLLVAVSDNPQRRREFLFVGPWISTPTVLVTRRDRPPIDGIRRFDGRRVGVLEHGQHAALLRASHPEVQALEYPTRDALLAAVGAGEVDGAFTNLSFAVPRLREGLGATLRIDGVYPELNADLYFAVRRDQPELAALLGRALEAITDDERASVAARWVNIDVQAGLSFAQWARIAAPYAAALLAALLLSLAWAGRLRREVRRANAAEAALGRARDRAETLARAREEFVTVASHEIRTPVNAVAGALSLLRGQPDGARRDELLVLAERSAATLRRYVDNLLDLSRIDVGQLRLHVESTDLRRSLDEPLRALGATLGSPGVAFSFAADPRIAPRLIADPLRLTQVLANLVANALRATPSGRVGVAIELLDEDPQAQHLRFSVSDTGKGIAPESLPRLFERFSGDGHLARAAGTTGLGLYLSQRLVEAMGGRITVQSTPGQGTRMGFDLRLARAAADGLEVEAPAPAGRESRAAAKDGPAARVLVAEDNRVQQMLIVAAFGARGIAVEVADDGEEALAAWRARRHPVVLADCQMPRMDGFALARALRAEAGPDALMLIATSADADDGPRALEAGMDRLCVKPLRDEVIDDVAARLRASGPH